MREMFGLSRPVPSAMSSSPHQNAGARPKAMQKWPAAMMQPPNSTAHR